MSRRETVALIDHYYRIPDEQVRSEIYKIIKLAARLHSDEDTEAPASEKTRKRKPTHPAN